MYKANILNISDTPKNNSLKILNVRIDNVKMSNVLDIIDKMIINKKCHQIVTVNPEFVMEAQKNLKFREVLNNAALSLPDGIGIVLASKLISQPLKERVTGIDTVQKLACLAAKQGWRIFFLGAAPGVAHQAAIKLQILYPGLQIAGTYSGSPNVQEEDEICSLIKSAKPQILLVAFGAPKQDLWIARNLERLGVPVAIGIGGTFDFIAGVARRAPLWVQKISCEWLFRLMKEPRRWKRMLALPKFIFLIFSSLISLKTINKEKS
ncbi:MAG: WecB/TagA/CpsF family glycosyltransferase [Bacteroidota bacterium]|nr:WecB/TagA/CpsF family glycosyltransferase [Bacteroidota bacterium]